jgi:hypothetical protein
MKSPSPARLRQSCRTAWIAFPSWLFNAVSLLRGKGLMRLILRLCAVATAAGTIGACAKRADTITAAYVSPLQYERLTCPQIAEEAQRINSRAAIIAGVQDEKATRVR